MDTKKSEFTIPLSIAIQSHLSDMLFEIETNNEELKEQAKNRINFLKLLILRNSDLKKNISIEELDTTWKEIINKNQIY